MLVKVDNRITISDITPELKTYIEKNLTFVNPDYAKKQRMGKWVGTTPKQIRLYEKNGSDYIVPYGMLKTLLPMMREAKKVINVDNGTQVNYNANIELYDYQKPAVETMVKNYFGVLQAPAGSGKTQMGLAMICKLNKKALWITHTKELLEQSYDRAKQYIDESLLGSITEGKVEIGEGITFATVQTLEKLDLPLYKNVWDVIIVDECHRVCVSASGTTMFAKVLNNLCAKYKYGLSATLHRADGLIKCTFAILGEIVHKISDEEVSDKIVEVTVKTIYTGIELEDDALNYDGTINYAEMINYLSYNKERNEMIVTMLCEEIGKPTLILTSRTEHSNILLEMLPTSLKNRSCVIDGKTKKSLRKQAMDDMRDGNKDILIATYNLAKEGLDIPRLERLYLASPQKDYAIITQSIGRIARKCDGKGEAIAYDFVDNDRFLYKKYKERCRTYRKIKVKLEEE